MLFGEIVEPSTRALIDDELEDYPDYVKIENDWEGNFEVPKQIDTLLFVESDKIKKLIKKFTIESLKPISTLKNGEIEIYNTDNDKYLVLFNEQKELSTGQIVEALSEWIAKANNIYSITSASISTYQNNNISNKPETIIRRISTRKSNTFNYEKLESPNLITGIGANVLSYCVHLGLECTLFVMYLDNSPLDSRNANPLVQLVSKIGLSVKTGNIKIDTLAGNLYM